MCIYLNEYIKLYTQLNEKYKHTLYRNINIYLTVLDYLNTSNVVLIVYFIYNNNNFIKDYITYIDEAIFFVIIVNIPLFLQDMCTGDRLMNWTYNYDIK